MPGIPRIDFFDFLFNRGRGVKPTQVDWSEPDADLDAKIASASQAAAVDQTARDAADAAQVDIDDHEANHPAVGVDQTARDAALVAQQAADTAQADADTAQGEIDTHEASTHNTDTTARNRGTTARNEAQEAQTTVDDHIANHPGNGGGGGGTPHTEQRVLQQDPQGTAATLGKFQIDPTGNAYGTVPDTELGVLATGDFHRIQSRRLRGRARLRTKRPIIPAGRALLPDRRPQAAGYDSVNRLPGNQRMGRRRLVEHSATWRKVSRGAGQRC